MHWQLQFVRDPYSREEEEVEEDLLSAVPRLWMDEYE